MGVDGLWTMTFTMSSEFLQGAEVSSSKEGVGNVQEKKDRFEGRFLKISEVIKS